MAAITLSRQLGSLGDEVAQAAAECLGYQVISRDLINETAKQCGSPEVALSVIDDLSLFGFHLSREVRLNFLTCMQKIMVELADQGNIIIVGRAGQVILRERRDVLHVKVIAPAELRAERIARQMLIPIEAAQAQINASDRNRRDYLRRFYKTRWDDPELYDLILNTARLNPEQAATLICMTLSEAGLLPL